jgi:hypothetical protein
MHLSVNLMHCSVDVRSVVQDIKQGEGVVSKILYDKKTAQRLDSVLSSLGIIC